MDTKDPCKESVKILKVWIYFVLGFLQLTLAINENVSDVDWEIKNLLKSLNKPYVKSIKSPYGYIIDCVPIHLQPAFDNPLLKNHTIQLKPSFYTKRLFGNFSSNEKLFTQQWPTKGRCPKGSVPVIRTTVEDILRAKSIQSFGKKTYQTIQNPNSPLAGKTNNVGRKYATRNIRRGEFYGAKAEIGIWNPRVQENNEFSLAQIWVGAGTRGVDLNTIEIGWQVYPRLYQDNMTHLFGYWTRDSYNSTGCYNMRCPGFVQTDQDVTLGEVLPSTSRYGNVEIVISIYVVKDRVSGNWWLKVGESKIGYWPADIFTTLRDSATLVDWGGEVLYVADGGRHTSTQMGSGAFSAEGNKKAASFAKLGVVNQSIGLVVPSGLRTDVTKPRCYDLKAMKSNYSGESFYYGGPGRSFRCP